MGALIGLINMQASAVLLRNQSDRGRPFLTGETGFKKTYKNHILFRLERSEMNEF